MKDKIKLCPKCPMKQPCSFWNLCLRKEKREAAARSDKPDAFLEHLKVWGLAHPSNGVVVCAWARQGWYYPFRAATEIIIETLKKQERLPIAFAAYSLELIHPELKKKIRERISAKGAKRIPVTLDLGEVLTLMSCVERERAFGQAALASRNLDACFSATPPRTLDPLSQKLEAAKVRLQRW